MAEGFQRVMRTILYVETGSGYGGSTKSLSGLLKALDRSHWRPVVAAHHEGNGLRKVRELGIQVHVLGGPTTRSSGYVRLLVKWLAWELPCTVRLVRLILRERVDFVHLNTDLYSTVAGLWAAKFTRRPVICHLRLTRPPTRLERWFGRWANIKVVLTQEAQAFYRKWWSHDRIECIPDGVEIPSESLPDPEVARESLGLPTKHPMVGLIARCVPGKGYEEFLHAAKLVTAQLPEAQFVIFGNGQGGDPRYETHVRRDADSLGLNGALIWAGWQSDMRMVYGAADLIVQASSTFPEGLSRVVLEAMAWGRPVVATDIVGNREAVRHQQTGLLVPPGDAQSLAEAILTLLRNPNVARMYGEHGKQRVTEQFSLQAHAERITQLYEEVLGRASVLR